MEEDLSEIYPEIEINLNLDSDSNSFSPYSSLSYLPCSQPRHKWLSAYQNWYLLWLPPSSPKDPCNPATSSLPYCWDCHIYHNFPPNWSWKKMWIRIFLPFLPASPLLPGIDAFPTLKISSPASPIRFQELSCCPQVHRVFVRTITIGR